MSNKIENKDIDDLKEEEIIQEDELDKKELTLDEMIEDVPEESREDLKNKIMKKVSKNNSSKDTKISHHLLSDQQKYLDAFINENRPIGTDEDEIQVIETTVERLKQEKYRTYDMFVKVGEDRTKLIERVVTDNNNVPIFDEEGNVVKEKIYQPIMEKYVVRRPTINEEIDLTKFGTTSSQVSQFMSDEEYDEIKQELCKYISNVIVEPELEVEDLLEMTSAKIKILFGKTVQLQEISDENRLVDFITGY